LSLDFFVLVYNCKATLVLTGETMDIEVTEDEWEYDEELYEELINHIIYDDNDGSITWSGNNYWPQSEKSPTLFAELMRGLSRKVT
jgi:pyruvate-formate lyase-activating enzyme